MTRPDDRRSRRTGGRVAPTAWPDGLETALRVTAEGARRGPPVRVEAVPVAPDSAHPTFRLDLRFGDGTEESWLAKELRCRSRPVDDAVARRQRELSVYRDLLPGSGLGTAAFVGDRAGDDGTHWLFLEFVEGTPLKWLGFDAWSSAVRWLARKDAHFQERGLETEAPPWLRRFELAYFEETARKSERAIREAAPELAPRLEDVLGYYGGVLPDLVLGRPTLVHGIFRPAQILVHTTSDGPRVCPVDWESAGSGSPVYDLASLTNGFEGEELAHLLESYRDSAHRHGADVPDAGTLHRALHATWIYRSLRRMTKSVRRGWDADDTRRFLGDAEAHVRRHGESAGRARGAD